MKSASVGWAIAIAASIVAIAGYAPERIDALAPAAGPLAHKLHDLVAPPREDAAKAPAGPAAVAVSLAPVRRVDAPDVLTGLGQVQAYNTVTVRTRVDGAIDRIGFVEGGMVKAGDLIAEIDPRAFQAALDQALAKKMQDQANLDNAKLDLQRYATLAGQSFATQQQLDTQKSTVNQLNAAIAADDAAIAAARVQLDYATIRAPISGRAGLRLIDQGNLVSASQQTAIVTLTQLQPIAVVFTAPQDEVGPLIAAMSKGDVAVAAKTAEGATLATGKLTVIDNQVDPTTATVKLKAEFANDDLKLWPGLAVATATTLKVDRGVLAIPATALQRSARGLFVYVVDAQNRAALREVKVARQTPDTAIVSEGLKDGDSVVATNLFLLQAGTPVRIERVATGS